MTNPLPSSSAIPGAVAALMSIVATVLPPDTTVWFGAELPTYSSPLTFQITEIAGDQQPAEMGPAYRREETFSIVCSLSTYAGPPPDFPTLLQGVMDAFALVHHAVANNPTLNHAVRYAQVGNFAIDANTDPNGMNAVTLDFSVRCEARVTSLT